MDVSWKRAHLCGRADRPVSLDARTHGRHFLPPAGIGVSSQVRVLSEHRWLLGSKLLPGLKWRTPATCGRLLQLPTSHPECPSFPILRGRGAQERASAALVGLGRSVRAGLSRAGAPTTCLLPWCSRGLSVPQSPYRNLGTTTMICLNNSRIGKCETGPETALAPKKKTESHALRHTCPKRSQCSRRLQREAGDLQTRFQGH